MSVEAICPDCRGPWLDCRGGCRTAPAPPPIATGEVRATAGLLAAALSAVDPAAELVLVDPVLDTRRWLGEVRVYPGRVELVAVRR